MNTPAVEFEVIVHNTVRLTYVSEESGSILCLLEVIVSSVSSSRWPFYTQQLVFHCFSRIIDSQLRSILSILRSWYGILNKEQVSRDVLCFRYSSSLCCQPYGCVFHRMFSKQNSSAGCGNCTVKAVSGRVNTIIRVWLGRIFLLLRCVLEWNRKMKRHLWGKEVDIVKAMVGPRFNQAFF